MTSISFNLLIRFIYCEIARVIEGKAYFIWETRIYKFVVSACKVEINSRFKKTNIQVHLPFFLIRDLRELNPKSQINLTRAGLMSTKATRMAQI